MNAHSKAWERVCKLSRLDLTAAPGGHRIWQGATTPDGRPRIRFAGRTVDPRIIAWAHANDGPLPPSGVQMRSICGVADCVAASHVSYVGDGMADGDFRELGCPVCGYTLRVLKGRAVADASCFGSGAASHRGARMR